MEHQHVRVLERRREPHTERTALGRADLEAVLSGLPPNIRGEEYLRFLDRLERAGLRFQRRKWLLEKSAPSAEREE